MPRTRTFTAGNREDALGRAAAELGKPVAQLDVVEMVQQTRVVDGREEKEVVVVVEVDEDEIDEASLLAGFQTGGTGPARARHVDARTPERRPEGDRGPRAARERADEAATRAPRADREAGPHERSASRPGRGGDGAGGVEERHGQRDDRARDRGREGAPPAPRPEAVASPPPRADDEDDDARDAEEHRPATAAGPLEGTDPEELVPIAEEFLANLLEKMDMDSDLELEWDDENIYIEIIAPDGLGGLLIGRKGQTLDAIQYLVNRVVLPGAAARGRIYLDTENYREKHRRKLEQMAAKLRDQALRTGEPVTVEELSARDRWIIHQALLDDRRVTTRSVGANPDRKLMIIPR